MRFRLAVGLVWFGVLAAWLYALGERLPYMDQVPVFDADATTTEGHMWARMWWDEGALKMWFSTPRAPRSIETPTMASRTLYESWPSGAFVPIYLAAKFLRIEPSVPLVNWINATMHGLIVIAVAFIAFSLALQNRMTRWSSSFVALAVSLPPLLSSGLIYVFSQIYDVVTAVLIYLAIFILLEVWYYGARSPRDKSIIGALQLITIGAAFLVDWLSYTVFAAWLMSRWVAGYLGIEPPLGLRRLSKLILLPIGAFSIYLLWRFLAPGSVARTSGISTSLYQLFWKILERMNLTDESHITGFGAAFIEMHEGYLSRLAFPLIVGSTLVALTLLIVAFRRANDPVDRRAVFATISILALVTLPFYAHMLVLYQHTYIHRWAITKAMFAYALIPFCILPISVFVLARLGLSKAGGKTTRRSVAIASLVIAGLSFGSSLAYSPQGFALLGRINRDRYLMWDDIRRNALYQDVVVSPVLEAGPITKEIGASYKLVHHAESFADVDAVVDHVCGIFNVVVALPEGTPPGAFSSREPAQVVDTGRIRLLRFSSYPGKAIGCP